MVKEENVPYGDNAKWKYVQPELLLREITMNFLGNRIKKIF